MAVACLASIYKQGCKYKYVSSGVCIGVCNYCIGGVVCVFCLYGTRSLLVELMYEVVQTEDEYAGQQ